VLGDWLVAESGRADIAAAALRPLLRRQSALCDRLVATLSAEYRQAERGRPPSVDERRRALVAAILAGELVDPAPLAYRLEDGRSHIGVIASGSFSADSLRAVAAACDAQLLLVNQPASTVWAWFGSRREIGSEEIGQRLAPHLRKENSVALGEPASGLDGWRLTHRQAAAASRVAAISGLPAASYRDVALLAGVMDSPILASSLRRLYLEPMRSGELDGRHMSALRSYFAAGLNVSAAAAALGVDRHTLGAHLRSIEACLGRPLHSCRAELEVTLKAEELKLLPVI
jgi:DNA-binding PucR family transcriptional regulator